MLPDAGRVAAILREVAAAEIMPRFRTLQAHQIREKRPGDLVTEADIEAELRLAERLRDLLPGAAVVGEEAAHADPGVMEALAGEAPVWILDPVDGTQNFAHGRATFGVIVALAMGGRTRMGWIYDPVGDVMAVVEAGQGAWIGERRLAVSPDGPVAGMAGSLGYRKHPRVAHAVAQVWRQGSVAHDYVALAEGRLQFAYYRRLKPWDHAAGVLMHAEAGGHSALLDGTPYRPLPSPIGVLLAPARASWQALRRLLDDEPA